MNKFEICNQLFLIEEEEGNNHGLGFIKNNIRYDFSRHSTGQDLNIYLEDGDKTLHIYHDNEWFYERYKFNDKGKRFGYLVKGPWVEIIENQFKKWESDLINYKDNQLKEERLRIDQKNKEELNNIKYFESKFA